MSVDKGRYRWIENVKRVTVVEQVQAWNAATDTAVRAEADFGDWKGRARAIIDDDRRIVYPAMRHGFVYNHRADAAHLRGIRHRSPEASNRARSMRA